MRNKPKHAVKVTKPKRIATVATVFASALGAMMLGGGTSYAQIDNLANCVNTAGGALCTYAAAPYAYAAVPSAYEAGPNAFAAVPNAYSAAPYAYGATPPYAAGASAYAAATNGLSYQPGTVYLPGAVAHNGEIIGADPDPNIRLNLMKDPNPQDYD